eukprot:4975589-Amphidinium_carterae.1
MEVAKEQANFREQAANYMHTGQQVSSLICHQEKWPAANTHHDSGWKVERNSAEGAALAAE